MPRPPKKSEAAAGGVRVIDPEAFTRVRDSVFSRLSTIQELIKNFSVEYLRQTNLLLGEPTILEPGAELVGFDQAALQMAAAGVPMPDMHPPVEEKKERKKRTHDVNAPKRPLTPYFLYMQTARPIIAGDLGEAAPKGAVQEEGQRRWASMSPGEKAGWNQAYQYNLRLYNARVHSYKAGNQAAKEMSDSEALKYADDFNIPLPTVQGAGGDDHAIEQQLQQAPPPVEESKTPKKGGARKRKSGADEVEAPSAVKPTPVAASPEKKRKRESKVAETKEEPKKPRGKKAGKA